MLFRKMIHKVRINTVFRNGLLFSFFSFLNSGINFVLLLVLANFIPPSAYGELNLFNTFVTLLAIFVSLNATGIIAVDYFSVSAKQLCKILNTVSFLSTISFLVFSFLLFSFPAFFEQIIGLQINYQWMGLLICYVQVFSTINLDLWRLEEKPIEYGLYSTAVVIANFLITLLLVVSFQMGWLGRLYAQVSVSLCFFFIAIGFMLKRGYIRTCWPDKTSIKEALRFGLPLLPHNASIWVRQGLDRYVINYFFTFVQVGLYSFAYNFANIIHIIGMAFNATNSVYIYKKLADDPEKAKCALLRQTKRMILFFSVLTLLVCFSLMVIIPLFIPQYKDSVPFLFPLCMSALFQCIYYLFVNYLFYYKKTKLLMYITFSMAVVHLLLSVSLTRYSVLYTAYITMFMNFMVMLLVFFYSRKFFKMV